MSDAEKKLPEKKPNIFVRIGTRTVKWFREMRSELKKVVWPTRKQVVNNSLIVIAAVILVGAVIALFDFGAVRGVQALIGLLR